MFLAEVILVTAVVLLNLVTALGSNATNSINVTIPKSPNVTIKPVTLMTTPEATFPILVTTLSPEDLKAKSKRRLGGLLRKTFGGRRRATSSSSGEKVRGKKKRASQDESLGLSSLSEVEVDSARDRVTKKGEVKSSADRKGWRKWHRKCQGCPDVKLKWREPKIGWICGAYQRARRSFKSLCVMHYRNCQDGTMFVKIADHKCPDDKPNDPLPHGDHFFYEYRVQITGESSKSSKQSNSKDDGSPSKSFDTFSLSGGSALKNSGSATQKKILKPINYRRRGMNNYNKIEKK